MKSIEPLRLLQDLIVYALCVAPIVVLRIFVEPYHRGFFCDDESIRYPNLPSTISMLAMALIGVIVPLTIILLVEAYRLYVVEPRLYGRKKILIKIDIPDTSSPLAKGVYIGDRLIYPVIIRFVTYAGPFLFGASACEALNNITQNIVGELRPHFIEACQPDWSRINCSYHRYVTDFVCLTTDLGTLKDARQSFPSGHASFGAFCACFAVLYLQKRASWPLSPATGRLIRPLIQYALLVAAFAAGLTRVADNQHHAMDVAFGFGLGAVGALAICYHFDIVGSAYLIESGDWIRKQKLSLDSVGETGDDKETTGLLYRD